MLTKNAPAGARIGQDWVPEYALEGVGRPWKGAKAYRRFIYGPACLLACRSEHISLNPRYTIIYITTVVISIPCQDTELVLLASKAVMQGSGCLLAFDSFMTDL